MAIKKQDRFNFFVPLELEKGLDSKGKEIVKIKGVASTTAKDSDGEWLEPAGFDYAPLLETGFLNWNHQAQKTSSAICGQPTDAKVINNGSEFYIEGFLYPNKEGKAVAELAETLENYSPDRRLGFSIEGQALERDILNPKKVKKARVTGVAITQCPKNPNTLLSIMKGEYAEAFVEEEDKDKEEETEKAMNVDINLNPESVEHGKKKFSEPVGAELKKSDIYDIILDRYPQNAPVREIFTFINTVSQKLFNMTTPTKESIQKAFAMVDEAVALSKGKESKAIDDDNDEEKDKDKDKGEDKKPPFEKAKDTEEEKVDEDEMKKAKDTAAILHKAGMDRVTACDTMIKGGIALNVAQGAYDSVVSEMNAKKDGGDISALQGSLIKAMKDELGTFRSSLDQEYGALGTDIQKVSNAFVKGMEGMRSVLDTLVKSNEELATANETLLKSNEEFTKRLEALEKQPRGPKSVTTRAFNDRFEKSNANNEVPAGCEAFNINDRADLSRLGDRLMAELDIMKAKGNNNPMLEKAIESIEIANHVPEEAYAHLRSLNIILQKSE